MTITRIRSTDGVNTDDGSTWALAKLDLAGFAASDVAGDTALVSQAHAETTAANVTLAFAGTASAPTQVICADDATESPTAATTGASVTTTGPSSLTITGHVSMYGLSFTVGSGLNAATFVTGNAGSESVRLERCAIKLAATTATNRIRLGQINDAGCQRTVLKNVDVKFAATGQRIDVRSSLFWDGGSVLVGTSQVTSLLVLGSRNSAECRLSGLDLSNLGSSFSFVDSATTQPTRVTIRNCKLPTGWSGTLFSAPPTTVGMRAEMYNCDDGDTDYRFRAEDYSGTVTSETVVVKTGGSAVGRKMVSSANASAVFPLESSEFFRAFPGSTAEDTAWVAGTAKTVTVELVHDSATTLTNADIWLEVQYMGTAGVPLSTFVSNAKADPLAVAANQTASTATWTTTGLTTPNKQKLTVSVTPQEKGYLIARVMLAKPGTTVFIDPVLTVA